MEDLKNMEMVNKINLWAAAVRESGQTLDENQVYSIMIGKLPKRPDVQALVASLQSTNKTYVEAVDALEAHFRTLEVSESQETERKSVRADETQVLKAFRPFKTGKNSKDLVCFGCGKKGHKRSHCYQEHPELRPSTANSGGKFGGAATKQVNAGKIVCDFCGKPGHAASVCRQRISIEKRKAQNKGVKDVKASVGSESKTAEPANALVIMRANLEERPDEEQIQLDSAADIHLCGVKRMFIGELIKLETPILIGGVNSKAELIKAYYKGTIAFVAIIEGVLTPTTVSEVYYVCEYAGTIVSQGVLTDRGMDVHTKGCKYGRPGNTKILKGEKVVLQGTQAPGSTRTYIDKIMGEAAAPNSSYQSASKSTYATCALGDSNKQGESVKETRELEVATSIKTVSTANQQVGGASVAQVARSATEKGTALAEQNDSGGEVLINPEKERLLEEKQSERAGGEVRPQEIIFSEAERSELQQIHERLGHVGDPSLEHTLELLGKSALAGKLRGARAKGTPQHISSLCPSCLLGKSRRMPHPEQSSHHSSTPGEFLSFDLFGPARQESIGGARYFGVGVDQASMFAHVFLVKKKSDFGEEIKHYIELLERRDGKKVKFIRLDNAGEYVGLLAWCKERGIEVQTTVAGCSAQNGQVERTIGQLTQVARTLLIACGGSRGFWGEAVSFACVLHNNTAHARIDWRTPSSIFLGREIDFSLLKVFGCAAYVLFDGADKLGPQAEECVYIGVTEGKKGFRVWNVARHRVFTVWHVKFIENKFPWKERKETERKMSAEVSAPELSLVSDSDDEDDDDDEFFFASGGSDQQLDAQVRAHEPDREEKEEKGEAEEKEEEEQAEAAEEPPARSLRENRGVPPVPYEPEDWRPRVSCAGVSAGEVLHVEPPLPRTHDEAMAGEQKQLWLEAEERELAALGEFKTFKEVSCLPKGKNALKGKFVYTIKRDETGKILMYKARYVACGYSQEFLSDYFLTKADVAETRSFRFILALAALRRAFLFQLDVSSAYLNGSLKEEIYICSPPGANSKYWQLLRPLYGLKQAGRNWRLELNDTLTRVLSMRATESDPGVYFLCEGGKLLVLAVHVDDMIGFGDDAGMRDKFIRSLERIYKIKYTYTPKWLLHMEIKQDLQNGTITLSQSQYIKDCLSKFKIDGVKQAKTPMRANVYLKPGSAEEQAEVSESDKKLYMELVGCLNYLATHTRADISFSVAQLSRYLHAPTTAHLKAAKNVFLYLSYTINFSVMYPASSSKACDLIVYSDANYGNDYDGTSTAGMCVVLRDNNSNNYLINWFSKRLRHVCLSTEEAELSAASEAAREAIALRCLLVQLGLRDHTKPINLLVDNKAAVDITLNGGYYPKLKHMNRRYRFVVQAHQDGQLEVSWCPGLKMLADALTKPLGGPALRDFTKKIFYCGEVT
jgi:hypothetical protein